MFTPENGPVSLSFSQEGGEGSAFQRDLLLYFTPHAGGAGGHRGALPLVLALAREYLGHPIGGSDAPRPLLHYPDMPVHA